VLLTRAPLRPKPSFDLHVLSLPPAFVLSQDQTLKLTSMAEPWNGARPKHYITLARCSDFGRPGIPVRRRLRIPSCLFTCQTAGNRFRSPSRSRRGPPQREAGFYSARPAVSTSFFASSAPPSGCTGRPGLLRCSEGRFLPLAPATVNRFFRAPARTRLGRPQTPFLFGKKSHAFCPGGSDETKVSPLKIDT
jgi:hypothetical protein